MDEFGTGYRPPDIVINLIAKIGGLLNPRPGERSEVNFELARIHRREKVLPHERQSAKRKTERSEKADHKYLCAALWRNPQQHLVALPESFKSRFKF